MFLNLFGKTHFLSRQSAIHSQIAFLLSTYQTSLNNFSFFANGKLLQSFQNLANLVTITAVIPLKGGKGGYGAKLKTEGGKKVRPNDNMFSRDTHGQKVVYATMQKQYKQFVKKKLDEDRLVAKEREQFKIMENTLRQGQSFMKLDQAYKKEIQTTERNLTESIMIGRQKLLQKYKLHEKQENGGQKIQILPQEQNKQQVSNQQRKESVKRSLPLQFKSQIQGQPQKKQKTQEQKAIKPIMLSAQQRFKLLFKKN